MVNDQVVEWLKNLTIGSDVAISRDNEIKITAKVKSLNKVFVRVSRASCTGICDAGEPSKDVGCLFGLYKDTVQFYRKDGRKHCDSSEFSLVPFSKDAIEAAREVIIEERRRYEELARKRDEEEAMAKAEYSEFMSNLTDDERLCREKILHSVSRTARDLDRSVRKERLGMRKFERLEEIATLLGVSSAA